MPPSDVHEDLVTKVEARVKKRGYRRIRRNPITTIRPDVIAIREMRRGNRVWLVEVETCKSLHSSHAEDQVIGLENFARTQSEWAGVRVSLCVPKACRRPAAMMLLELLGTNRRIDLLAI